MYYIREKGCMPDNTEIQIEDWSEAYPTIFCKNSIIAAYPKAKESVFNRLFDHLPPYPMRNKTFRAWFEFDSAEEAKTAFGDLISGRKTLLELAETHFHNSGSLTKERFFEAMQYKEI